jgi:hypothetical protein
MRQWARHALPRCLMRRFPAALVERPTIKSSGDRWLRRCEASVRGKWFVVGIVGVEARKVCSGPLWMCMGVSVTSVTREDKNGSMTELYNDNARNIKARSTNPLETRVAFEAGCSAGEEADCNRRARLD